MGNYTDLMSLEKKAQMPASSPQKRVFNQPTSQSTQQSVPQSTDRQTDKTDDQVVGRPKSFYITNRLDQRLNSAVQYLQEKHGIRKVDRSILLTAMLDTEKLWANEALDKLVEPVLSILTSRLIK